MPAIARMARSYRETREEYPMSNEKYEKGLAIRTQVLGEAYVSKSIQNADDFTRPLQEMVTEYCWGHVWGREGLSLKERSMINLAMISALNRPHELKLHVRGRPAKRLIPRADPRDPPAGRHLLRGSRGGGQFPPRPRSLRRGRRRGTWLIAGPT